MKTEIKRPEVMRDARLRMHWTQLKLARQVGCSESQIAKLETGRLPAPAQWLREAIARELGIGSWEVVL
jgi:transcriptional regulator with XRE-family HTH domain